MGCLLALLALISPRLVLFLLWIFSNVLSRAFDSWIIPLLGFFLLPWTTLTYAAFWDWGSGHHVTGFEWFFVVLAFLIDLGSYAQGPSSVRARGRLRAPSAPGPQRGGRISRTNRPFRGRVSRPSSSSDPRGTIVVRGTDDLRLATPPHEIAPLLAYVHCGSAAGGRT